MSQSQQPASCQQLAVANPRSYEHSIEHYLAHSQVATLIADALNADA
jgi:hypothetical protein